MHVDDFLDTTPLPDVAVGTEDALARTVRRGDRRRWRRASLATLAAVTVVAGGAIGILVHDADDEPNRVSTGPDDSSSTTLPPTLPEPGQPATWVVDAVTLPTPDSSTVSVLVRRQACHGGETGRVLRPGVVVEPTRVRITINVEHDEGSFTCQENKPVAAVVDLGVPLGDRALVDGACAPGPELSGAPAVCADDDDGVRWQPLKPPLHAVSGVLQMVGGPAGAEADPVPGGILAYDEARRPVAEAAADAAGRFTIELPAGTYDLVGTSRNFITTESTCHTYHGVVVGDEDVTGVTVDCLRR